MARASLGSAALLCALSISSVALARPQAGASARVESDARTSIRRGDVKGALEKIRKAREAEPAAPSLALLQAQAYLKADDAPRAMRSYQEFLRLAGKDGSTKERAEAVARIQDLSIEVGAITVRARPGSRILVDGELIGTAPLADPIPVAPGKHSVSVEGSPARKVVSVKAEESAQVEFEGANAPPPKPEPAAVAAKTAEPAVPAAAAPAPAPAPAAPAAAPPAPAPEQPTPEPDPFKDSEPAPKKKEEPKSKAWIGWTAAGALGAGAIVSGVVGAGAISDYETKKETMGVTRGQLEDAQSKGQIFTGLALGLGAAAVTVATITILSGKSSKERPKEQPSVGVFVAPTFVGAGGSFR